MPQPVPVQLQIPLIELGNCRIQYEKGPDGVVRMLVGPIMLCLPFTEENARDVASKLTQAAGGIVIAPAGVFPPA